jgi:hypothetical protein
VVSSAVWRLAVVQPDAQTVTVALHVSDVSMSSRKIVRMISLSRG